MDQFIDLCILCGCDYCDSIKGIIAYSFRFHFVVHIYQIMQLDQIMQLVEKFSNCMRSCPLGIGGLTALKLIRQHGSIEGILENINKDKLVLIHFEGFSIDLVLN